MKAVIKPPEASRITGMTGNDIRRLLRMGAVPWGKAVLVGKTPSGNKSFRYYIYTAKLLDELGIKGEDIKDA